MEEEVRKMGLLYLQQQKFGKKWKKVWSLAYRDSGHSVSRLELQDWREDAAERGGRGRSKRESRKVIRMSDFLCVTEEKGRSCPQGCAAFRVDTVEKSFRFAAEAAELEDWIRALCEIAFPMNQTQPEDSGCGMVENSIYCTSSALKDFPITVKETEASARCHLHGPFVLRVDVRALHLLHPETGATRLTWPFQHIRKFGINMCSFSLEAGRMSDSGEGVFEFNSKRFEQIFQAVDAAIEMQSKGAGPRAADPIRHIAPDNDDLYSKVTKVRRPRPSADAVVAGVEDLALDDAPGYGRVWGRSLSNRPLPPPAGSPVDPPHDGELSETEPDYEEVDAGSATTLEARAATTQEPPCLYDNIDKVKGHASHEDPSDHTGNEGGRRRQLERMMTNPWFDAHPTDPE